MATVRVHDRTVIIQLAWWERLFAAGRSRFVVPADLIATVGVVDQPTRWTATPGARSGLVVTGVLKVGRWGIGTGVRHFVSVRRDRPALRLTTTAEGADLIGYHVLLVSTPEAPTLAADLTSATQSTS
ncbi:hypothetical protein Kfla_6220 [Kribbella flavida DSM 17836]|uniref:Uncharacterized protein n=1 Tax=Kribbella flavida (strain DSM 17836 / JCM 10339 / NBRC 14399) TaxID=479435 RepID=D2PVI3_KRIFD|nr:hypothetical protein [Kribbella flavida]ADB35223.1 hypothetical protein Kfla_6220 [Kribbella flavida DSM 17836]